MSPVTWTIEIVFSEDEDKTRADARLSGVEGAQVIEGILEG